MASQFNKMYAAMVNEIPARMFNNVIKRSPTLTMLTRKEKKWDSGGDTIQPAITYQFATNAGSYRGYDPLDISPQQTLTDAEFRRKQNYASIVYNGYETASSRGKNAIIKMMDVAMTDAENAIFNNMATQIFADGTGNGGKDILGLAAAIDDGTGTAIYAGIDRSSNTFWRAGVTPVGGNLSMTHLTTAFVSASRGGVTNSPDFIVCGLTAWLAINTLARNRFQEHAPVNNAGKMFANLGFPMINFMGVPVVYDEYCPTGVAYMLNSETVQLWSDPVVNMKPTELVKPANMDALIGQILWTGELICTEPRANWKLTGITGADTTTP